MEWRKLVSELELTRKDRIGVVALAFLVILSIFLPSLVHKAFPKPDPPSDTSWIAAIRELETEDPGNSENPYPTKTGQNQGYRERSPGNVVIRPFLFDPNSISAEDWRKLGLPEKTIRTILNYRNKGGKFRVKEDLKKIYGIRPEHYEILEAYIRISTEYPKKEEKPFSAEKAFRRYEVVNINMADTSAFIALPGIGSKLAQRIISFREKLGGFYSLEQVREVYGLADSVYQKIKQYLELGSTDLRRININDATEAELKDHPYIRFVLAKPIIAYRDSHGKFRTVEEIRNILAVTEEAFIKMKPYLSVE